MHRPFLHSCQRALADIICICDVIPIQPVVLCPIDPSKAIVAQMCAWGSFDFGSSLSSRLLNAPVASQIKVVIVDIAY